jgi:type IV secretory pathway virB4 component-like protein
MGLFKTKDSSNKNKQNKTSNKKKSKDKTISELEQNFGYPTSPSRNSEFINNRQQGFYNQNPNLNQASNQFVTNNTGHYNNQSWKQYPQTNNQNYTNNNSGLQVDNFNSNMNYSNQNYEFNNLQDNNNQSYGFDFGQNGFNNDNNFNSFNQNNSTTNLYQNDDEFQSFNEFNDVDTNQFQNNLNKNNQNQFQDNVNFGNQNSFFNNIDDFNNQNNNTPSDLNSAKQQFSDLNQENYQNNINFNQNENYQGFNDLQNNNSYQEDFSTNSQTISNFDQYDTNSLDPRLNNFIEKSTPITPNANYEKFQVENKDGLPGSFSLKTANFEFQEDFNPRQETIKEAIAPSAYKRGEIDFLIIGSKYARVFCIEGLPDQVYIGYLRVLYSSDYDVDINLSIQPRQQSAARKELQDKVTVLRAQLEEEIERGGNRNRDTYADQIQRLEGQIRELSSREESAFEAQFLFVLYADSREELSRHTINILQELKEERITAQVLALRQDEGYRTVAPYAIDYLKDKKRNFNTGATISSIPFYVPELYDDYGVYLGINTYSGTPALIDLYKDGIQNSNLNVFGSSGSGKSTLVKTLTMRSALHGVRTVIIDPEGEYSAMTKKLHGGVVRLSTNPENSIMMNLFDIEESVEIDNVTGEQIRKLELRPKYVDVLGFIKVIFPTIDKGQEANLLEVIERLYFNFGFIDGDVDSLYYNDDVVVENGRLVNNLRKKTMPTLNDLINLTHTMVEDGTYSNLREVFEALQPYRARKTLGIFDTQTPKQLQRMADLPVITFDVSAIESSDIKTLSMYVLLSWIWEKFGKKNPHIKKRVLVDEAWMMMSPSQPGYQYTSTFLETMSRRIRKRNGGLCVASQKIDDFNQTPQGRAVLTNAHTTFLLNHQEFEVPALRKAFDLDEGIIQNIINVERGRVLIKQGNKLYLCNTQTFENEKKVVFTGPQTLV